MAIRVVVAEDQRIVREVLAARLARESDIEVLGTAGTGREAIDMAQRLRPDVLLLDISLPDLDGITVARALRGQHPRIKLIAVSMHEEARVVQDMLDAGADGYVVKSAGFEELLQAIRSVTQDKIYLSPDIARKALGRFTAGPGAAGKLGRRERQVLALLAEGMRSAEIAARLSISVATVEVHRRNIMRKLGLHTIAELTKFAVREGLTSL